jgi:hypothetical protein
MAKNAAPTPIDHFPPELVQAVAHEATLDADWVGIFLNTLGLAPDRTGREWKPMHLPASLLLGLGAALRLFRWEQNGVLASLQPDLPPARQMICQLFQLAAKPQQAELDVVVRALTSRVFTLWLERLAWSGQEFWDADLVLGDAEEDELVEVLADFLWAHRNSSFRQQGGGE